MEFIDTHAHFYAEEFDLDRTEGILRAKENHVSKILLPNIDLDSINPLLNLHKSNPAMFHPMLGLHPGYVKEDWETQLNEIKKVIEKHSIIAIGEIGMDLYWDKTFIEEQKMAFSLQIDWAMEHKLPIVIHARESFHEIFEILDTKNCSELSGVFHCFTGSELEVQKILSLENFYFGIGGVITYKNSPLAEVVKTIPLSKIVIETDSPYLPPTPFRGKRNEPSYIIHIAEKLASIFEIGVDEIAKRTTYNANKLFQLKA
ncbi:MAG: TatD family deoxyribonuclease [Bacteroidetes bacterium]|nr:TatD family deoxyribonuclease [Bacteroidota bacterium]